jgi:hypothetical protein
MALVFSGHSEGDATCMQMIERMLLQFLFESVETARTNVNCGTELCSQVLRGGDDARIIEEVVA